MKPIRLFTMSCVLLIAGLLSGCAHLNIPAPETPVVPLPEPVIEDSTITLPVAVSLKSILENIGQAFSQGDDRDRSDRETNLSGKIQEFLQRQASRKENNVLRNAYVRQLAGRAWSALQGPVKLTDDLSLLINPRSATLTPRSGPPGTINAVVGLVAHPKLVSGPEPPASAQSLPELALTPTPPEKGFHIAVESELSFEYLGNELTKKMTGRTSAADGETVIIENITLYGAGGAVVVAVRVKGTVQGTIYLTGVPVYDESARVLSVRNLEYTVETQQVLAKAADWLLHSTFKERLAGRATWFIGDRIDAARALLEGALNRKLNQHMEITGSINALRLVAVGITEHSVKAVLVADGTVELTVL